MKYLILLFALLFVQNTYSQEWKKYPAQWAKAPYDYMDPGSDTLLPHQPESIDLSPVLLRKGYFEEGILPYEGVFDTIYKKIEMIFTSAEKLSPRVYIIKGKSKLDKTICDFEGVYQLESLDEVIEVGANSSLGNLMISRGTMTLKELGCRHTGTFSGKLCAMFFLDDDQKPIVEAYESTGFWGFVGSWKSKNMKLEKYCLFGHGRFPHKYAPNFDVGDGEELINILYLRNGWKKISVEQWQQIIKEEFEELVEKGHYPDFKAVEKDLRNALKIGEKEGYFYRVGRYPDFDRKIEYWWK